MAGRRVKTLQYGVEQGYVHREHRSAKGRVPLYRKKRELKKMINERVERMKKFDRYHD